MAISLIYRVIKFFNLTREGTPDPKEIHGSDEDRSPAKTIIRPHHFAVEPGNFREKEIASLGGKNPDDLKIPNESNFTGIEIDEGERRGRLLTDKLKKLASQKLQELAGRTADWDFDKFTNISQQDPEQEVGAGIEKKSKHKN